MAPCGVSVDELVMASPPPSPNNNMAVATHQTEPSLGARRRFAFERPTFFGAGRRCAQKDAD